ncbi:hypothetical protein GCM10028807_01790 [Spirosoma daeguense]
MQPSTSKGNASLSEPFPLVTYQISGFDRVSFVNDVTSILPHDGSLIIRALSFEADGVRVKGSLTVQIRDTPNVTDRFLGRLQSVQGLVSIKEVHYDASV